MKLLPFSFDYQPCMAKDVSLLSIAIVKTDIRRYLVFLALSKYRITLKVIRIDSYEDIYVASIEAQDQLASILVISYFQLPICCVSTHYSLVSYF